jgi:hypothetical protein
MLAAALLPACTAPTRTPAREAAPAAADVRLERSDQAFALGRDVVRVEIDNPWGEITLRNRDERELGVHAVIQRLPPAFAPAALRTRRDRGTLRVAVEFPAAAARGRVDLAVYLPADVAVALATRDGRIAAKRRSGPVEARTDSGPILASSLARLDLASRSGPIRAALVGARWQGASRIASDSGQLLVRVPTFGDVALDARTGGRLVTDFGLGVRREGGLSRAQARYGRGTSALDVHSRSGEIVLAQLVLVGEDAPDPEDED